jgi:hypothetical protein
VAASLAEDVVAIGSVFLAAFYPILLVLVVVAGLMISMVVLPRTIRYLRAIIGKLRRKAGTTASS